jgi:hypothetical protein
MADFLEWYPAIAHGEACEPGLLEVLPQKHPRIAGGRESVSLCATQRDFADITASGKLPQTVLNAAPMFWKLYDQHCRQIIGLISRDITLLSSLFCFLCLFPELLGFTFRVKLFQQKNCKRIEQARSAHPSDKFVITVSRGRLIRDSFRAFETCSIDRWLARLYIKYADEEAIDEGGVLRN